VLPSYDVLDVEGHITELFRQATILATILGPLPNKAT
jgi:hypothetical protein